MSPVTGRVLDLLYVTAGVLAGPWWLVRLLRRGRLRTDWAGRFGRGAAVGKGTQSTSRAGMGGRGAQGGRQRLLIHAVSVGEVNAIRRLVERLRCKDDGPDIIVSVTTDTGMERARDVFNGVCEVVRYPFDLSGAVRRFLDRVKPDVVVLFELEVWPNFVRECEQRGISVAVINGRLSERSLRRYRLVRRVIGPSLRRLSFAAVQNETYARRFAELGMRPTDVLVTGTMKWDAVDLPGGDDGETFTADPTIEHAAAALAEEMGIDRTRPLIVAGSTAPGEHELLRDARPAGVQLLCAPRRPEWFDPAARALPGSVRRTQSRDDPSRRGPADLYLLDTIGELRAAYSLADIVVVGRTFGELFGSDMMEPVALGKATVIGPAVSDFQEMADALIAGDGLVQASRHTLAEVFTSLLADPARRRQLACNGLAVVREHQGATDRHAELILALLDERTMRRARGKSEADHTAHGEAIDGSPR